MVTQLVKLLSELLDGPASDASWVLNPGDAGLLASLDRLSAAQASTTPPSGAASIAAHVDHLRYGFELTNRWSQGEQPFADANYRASWEKVSVTESEWAERRRSLRDQAYAWRDAMQKVQSASEAELTGIAASVVHLAYHIGAIRQIDRSIRGPAATD
jgi:hypothetical protein